MNALYNLDQVWTLHFSSIQQLRLLQNFENTTFPLKSMVKLLKNCHKNLENCFDLCSFNKHGWNLMKLSRILPYTYNFQMTRKAQ